MTPPNRDEHMQAPPPRPFAVLPIGIVRRDGSDTAAGQARIELDGAFREGLLDLERFSHVLVLWWAQRHDNDEDRRRLRVHPRHAPQRTMGVFATRSPARPNPVAVTVCRLLDVDERAGVLRVADIDADDGSPVIDLKAYFPSADRVRNPDIPSWFADLPEWAADEPADLTDAQDVDAGRQA